MPGASAPSRSRAKRVLRTGSGIQISLVRAGKLGVEDGLVRATRGTKFGSREAVERHGAQEQRYLDEETGCPEGGKLYPAQQRDRHESGQGDVASGKTD